MPTCNRRSSREQHQGNGDDRRAQHENQAGGVHGPDKQRQPEPGHSGSAHLVNGDDEIQAGEDGRKSGDENSERGGNHVRVRVGAAEGRIESPAGVDAARCHGVQHEAAAGDENIPAHQIELGEGHVAGADHQGNQEISERRGNRRHQEEENHDDAVDGEQLVVSVGLDQRALRLNEIEAHQHRGDAADQEHQRDRAEIEQSDALVVERQQPGLDAVPSVQIIDAGFGRSFVQI